MLEEKLKELNAEIEIRKHMGQLIRQASALLSQALGIALLLSDQVTAQSINDALKKIESVREFNAIALTAAKAIAEERLPLED